MNVDSLPDNEFVNWFRQMMEERAARVSRLLAMFPPIEPPRLAEIPEPEGERLAREWGRNTLAARIRMP